MGQRLVITIHAFNEDIAKIYYHWSAYSVSALNEAKDIIENVDWSNSTTKDELILKLINFIEENGGGIDGGIGSEEYNYVTQYFKSKYQFSTDPNRNHGLIAISEKCMDEMQMWSEGDLEIDFDNHEIFNQVFVQFNGLSNFNNYMQDCEVDEFESLNEIPELSYDLSDISFENLCKTIDELENIPSFVCRYKETIFELIE